MSEAVRGKIALASASEFRARAVSDRDEIAAFLRTDRLYAAYALGDLDGPNRARLAWGLAVDRSGTARGLGMQHMGLAPQTLFLMGDPAACRAVLGTTLRPRLAFVQATEEYRAALIDLYDLDPPVRLLRMVVDRASFLPWAGSVERLTTRDVDDLNRLYRLGLGSGFPASVLDEGVYYGVRANGRLVAAAGTHAINPREGLAVVGNVMTHADYRGRGFAKAVTSAVTAELLDRVPDVVLNVHATNGPAVAAYSHLGYLTHRELTEWVAGRRGAGWALTAPLRAALRWSRTNRSDP
jgi:ribosomal protein S18 acetylase RimI-like enzyme